MAKMTGDERSAVRTNQTFVSRVEDILMKKAEYWRESATPNRSDVNKQMQKRKRMAYTLLTTSAVQGMKDKAAQFWLAYYEQDPPVLDGNGIPTYDEIFNSFDPTFDFCAGVVSGDSILTEIDW